MVRLEEGRKYLFTPVKVIELPGGEQNLMLSGPDNKKYLLPLKYYENYALTTKSVITCKIDKINCSGKVFLEPEHPVYREGENYDFKVISAKEQQDGPERIFVTDIFGNELLVPPGLALHCNEHTEILNLKIERISKGKIYFQSGAENENAGDLAEGQLYDFRIDRIVTGEDDEDYYAAVDTSGSEHFLKVRYYAHYGFKTGITFTGKVIRYGSGRRRTIEPENPWYKPGDIVKVTISGYTPLETGEGYMAEVFDSFGFSHSIILESKPLSPDLECRVIKIRKGKPVLSPAFH